MRQKLLMICFLMGALLFGMGNAMAQTRTITGTVTGQDGKPLESASVIVTGNSRFGSETDRNGSYAISVPATATRLTFSSIGFSSKTLTIEGTTLNVQLDSVQTDLSEVVVTGIVNVKKSYYSGALTTLTPKELSDKPVGSFDQLLQGRVPGLLAYTSSGQPGNATNVIIRGSSSISGGSTPLYIIDGIPTEAAVFQGINPNDFETLDVIRDAAGAALYGSRASAGVIVATTKRGVAGKLKVTYDGQVGVKSRPSFSYSPMNTAQLLAAQESYGSIVGSSASTTTLPGWYYSPQNPRYQALSASDQAAADNILDSISQIDVNWKDYIFRNGTFNNHSISLSGGAGRTRFYSSLNYYNEKGVTARTDMNRIQFRNNLDYADDKFKFSLSSNLAFVRRNFQQSTTTNSTGNPFLAYTLSPSYAKVYNSDGSYATGTGAKYVAANMLDLTKYDVNGNNQIKANLSLSASYKITRNITAALTSGIDFRETQSENYGSKLAYSRVSSTTATGKAGFQTETLDRYFNPDIRPSLNYNNVFNGKHEVDFSIIGEYLTEYSKYFNMTGYGIDPRTPNTPAAITTATATNLLFPSLGGSKSRNSLYSGLATARYTFASKYTFTASYRSDGSSKLPKDNRWAGFYSIGGIWDIKKESFLNTIKNVDILRLRASYGSAGSNSNSNFAYGNYGYLPQYAVGTTNVGNPTLYISNIGNPDLKWETVYTVNIGVDYGFFNNRLYGDLNVYDKTTKNLFVQKTLSSTSGQGNGGSIIVNAGKLSNKGFEWNVNVDVIKTSDILWTVSTNGAYNKNKVVSLGGISSYTYGTSLVEVGKPIGSHYEVKWAGVDQATGRPLYYKLDGSITSTYSTADKVTDFGTWESPWKGGFGTDFAYKSFDLNVLFSWQKGGYKEDNLQYFEENPVGFLAGGYNQSSSLKFWQHPGDIVNTPSPLYSVNFSSNIIHSTSFMRLRDVVLSYSVPKVTLSKIKVVSSAKLFIQASNLFMWTHWRGMDPEAGVSNINLSEFPNPKAITGGLNITF